MGVIEVSREGYRVKGRVRVSGEIGWFPPPRGFGCRGIRDRRVGKQKSVLSCSHGLFA